MLPRPARATLPLVLRKLFDINFLEPGPGVGARPSQLQAAARQHLSCAASSGAPPGTCRGGQIGHQAALFPPRVKLASKRSHFLPTARIPHPTPGAGLLSVRARAFIIAHTFGRRSLFLTGQIQARGQLRSRAWALAAAANWELFGGARRGFQSAALWPIPSRPPPIAVGDVRREDSRRPSARVTEDHWPGGAQHNWQRRATSCRRTRVATRDCARPSVDGRTSRSPRVDKGPRRVTMTRVTIRKRQRCHLTFDSFIR